MPSRSSPRYKRPTRAKRSVESLKSKTKKKTKPRPRRVPKTTKLGRPIDQVTRALLARPRRQLTTKELIKSTDRRVKARAAYQKILVMRILSSKVIVRTIQRENRRYPVPHIELRLEVRGLSGIYQVHLQIPIDIKNKRKLLENYPIKVYCSCPDFKYRRAYVLKLHRNLITRKALGLALVEPPLIRNPFMIPGTCKHVLVALRWIRRRSLMWLLSRTRGVFVSPK